MKILSRFTYTFVLADLFFPCRVQRPASAQPVYQPEVTAPSAMAVNRRNRFSC